MKIKKYGLHILILIVLIVIFIPMFPVHVQAQQPCQDYDENGNGIPPGCVTNIVTSSTFNQTCTGTGLGKLICQTQQILNSIIPLLVALGVVYFVYGVVTYVIGDGEEAKKKGRDRIIYGIIGLAVIISLWGLVTIVVNTFNLGGVATPTAGIANLGVNPGASSGCTAITSTSKFPDVLNYVTCVIGKSVIPLIFALAMVSFIWGAVNFFIINAAEEAKREQGKQFMLWGVIALAVMLSVWGLVNILTVTFGLNNPSGWLPSVRP